MTTVGIRVLKNRLSEYARRVSDGERIVVTNRGTPVMDLVPHTPAGEEPEDPFVRMARAGEVILGKPNDAAIYDRPRPWTKLSPSEIADLLDWVRGER